jgi:formamidopyrimidine-DNA glycosylase
MPEVCEVTLTAQILENKLKNKILTKCKILSGRYTKSPPFGWKLFQDNLPYRIKAVRNKGKFLWFSLVCIVNDNNNDNIDNKNKMYIWNTFGLTGGWGFDQARSIKSGKFEFELEDGFKFWYYDVRNFGTMKFDPNKLDLVNKIKTLAPDFLQCDDWDLKKITKYHKKIIEVLMSQKLIGSGLGNYLSVEILYRAKISPHQMCDLMPQSMLNNLNYWIKYVTKICYMNNHTGYMKYFQGLQDAIPKVNYHPSIDLDNAEFQFAVYRQKLDLKGNKVIKEKIIKGRSTYWVPSVQKEIK